jgi:hypothetical protein
MAGNQQFQNTSHNCPQSTQMTSQHEYQPLHPGKACELTHQDLGPVVSVLGSSKSESSLMEMVK